MVKTIYEKKVQYAAPKVNTFEVTTENVICLSNQFNSDWHTEYYDLDEDEDI